MNHNTPIHHSSTAFQFQGISDLKFSHQERKVRVSAMEDSSNGKVEEAREVQSGNECEDVVVEDVVGDSSKFVDVESVKVLEINDEESEPASKRGLSIMEEIIESAEKVPDGDDSSSSSSSLGEEERKVADQVEEKEAVDDLNQEALVENVKAEIDGLSSQAETEEKTSSSVEKDVAYLVSKGVTETKFQSSYENDYSYDEGVDRVGQKNEANRAPEEEVSKGIERTKVPVSEENNIEESSQAVYEAAIRNVDNPGISENTQNPSPESVTRPSPQPTIWKSCCGLLEVLRPSDRKIQGDFGSQKCRRK